METDIVLVRHPATGKCVLGKTQSFKSVGFGVQAVQASIRCFVGRASDSGLQMKRVVELCKVFSCVPLRRRRRWRPQADSCAFLTG